MKRCVVFPCSGRVVCSAALLVLLAVCSCMNTEEVKTVSAPLQHTILSGQEIGKDSVATVRTRLLGEREREIALLDSVSTDPSASLEIKRRALEQKTALAVRMESEAQIEAALLLMGFPDTAVLCGEEMVTVFASFNDACEEVNRIRMIDAAASQMGISADNVSIILTKK